MSLQTGIIENTSALWNFYCSRSNVFLDTIEVLKRNSLQFLRHPKWVAWLPMLLFTLKGTEPICDEKIILHTKLIVYCPCDNVKEIH